MKKIDDARIDCGKFVLDDYRDDSIVTDRHIAEIYGIRGKNVFYLPRGEQAKTFACAQRLCRWFLRRRLGAGNRVVAVGGGSIGDVTGFACGIYKRGALRLLHVPTTVVAMVDSAIGGKTALDVDGVKNAVGNYFFADVLTDFSFFATLGDDQLLSGKGEILKYCVLCGDPDLVKRPLNEQIAFCADYKREVCLRDPYCEGERNKLNFGHTVAHAMELALGLPHGVAVANGIFYETSLAFRLGLCDANYAEHWRNLAKSLFDVYPFTEEMAASLLQDKKNVNGQIGFVLPAEFKPVLLDISRVKALLLQ